MTRRALCSLWACLIICAAFPARPVCGGQVLLDAETEKALSAWSHLKKVGRDRAPYLPLQGTGSAQLDVASWKAAMGDGRAEVRLADVPTTDWRLYDRLTLDVLNDGPVPTLIRIEVNTPSNEGRRHFALPAGRWVRIVLPTAELDPELADLSRVRDVQIAVRRQAEPLVVYLDNMRLLTPAEAVPAPAGPFLAEVARRLKAEAARIERVFAETRPGLGGERAARIAGWCAASALEELKTVGGLLELPDMPSEVFAVLGERIDRAARNLSRIPSIVALAKACEGAGTQRDEDVLVGVATSMTKLLPREMPVDLVPATKVELAAARNETESFQVAVLPLRRDLKQITVQCGDLHSDSGEVLPRERIDCDVMGYVETREQPPEELAHVGWWPDPILDFLGPVDVARSDLQSFWVRVRVPKGQPSGEYHGEVAIGGQGMNPVVVPLVVRVHSFVVPDWSPLPTAVSFGPPLRPWSAMLEELVASPRWNAGLKYRWADFLADYYISCDHLYRRESPDFDIIDHLHKAGRLGVFNLGNFDVPKADEGQAVDPKALAEMLDRVGIAYQKAKDRGLLDHAYIYGFDEVKPEWFDTVEQAAAAVKQRMPGVFVLTTTYDDSFGRDTKMVSIDGWTPKTEKYDPDLAAQARQRGDQVWWYICIAPRHPYANIFLEYAAIEARLLMGAMTARYRPDGFLYYQTSLWQAKEPIRTGPFTNWDPRSYRDAHGDGSWLCMNAEGLPVPTIRLENYRDGLEDYAYVRLLEEAIRVKEARAETLTAEDRQWLSEAKTALKVPQELVASLTGYSREPARLYAWRDRLAGLIGNSGEQGLDPWGNGFTLRRR